MLRFLKQSKRCLRKIFYSNKIYCVIERFDRFLEIVKQKRKIMKKFVIVIFTSLLFSQTAQVQIIHNSPYPTVDIYVDGSVALTGVEYRACTGLIDLPVNTTVGIAPTGDAVIAEFPFELSTDGSYVVTASGILGDENTPFNLLASALDQSAQDEESFALKVLHGATDAPAVDIYANGSLLVDSLAYGDYAGYVQVPAANYTIDITAHGSSAPVASFSAPLADLGGGSGVVYASGFLAPTELDSAFTLILATPSGYTVELPETETALEIDPKDLSVASSFILNHNYPNPFNPSTLISYSLTRADNVELDIRDVNGRFVKSLVNSYQEPGSKRLNWDGTNSMGTQVSAGVYFYSIKVGENIQTKKMVLLK